MGYGWKWHRQIIGKSLWGESRLGVDDWLVATNQDIKSWISLFHFLSSKFQALFLSSPLCVCVCVCVCVLSLSLFSLSSLDRYLRVCFCQSFFFGRWFASTVVVRCSCVCGWGNARVFSHICFCMCVCVYVCVSVCVLSLLDCSGNLWIWISLFHFLSSKFQAFFLSSPLCACVRVRVCSLSLSLWKSVKLDWNFFSGNCILY